MADAITLGMAVARAAILIMLGAALWAFCGAAQAQSFPNKPIRLVVQFAPGGSADAVARLLATRMGEDLGQSVIVENRAGAGGMIANEYVARAAPDGYTLLLGSAGGLAITPLLAPKEGFDPVKSLAPVAPVVSSGFILVVPADNPANDLQGLIKLLKANPGKYNYGSSGTGGSPHLAGELFKRQAGVDIVHVPYTGLGPAIAALLGGQIQLLFADVGLVAPHIKAGKLKAIAYTGADRTATFPQLPTMIQAGMPGFVAGSWYGILAPAGTPRAVVDKLNQVIVKDIKQPDMQKQFAAQGLDPVTISTPQQFTDMIKSDIARWSEVIRSANIKIN
jgi:tripartite-type tricarboxylate transporter receptor subunit TctC